MPVMSVHEDLFRHMAQHNAIPSDRRWSDDVLPVVVSAVKELLEEALAAFRASSSAQAAAKGQGASSTSAASGDYQHSEESFQAENAYLVEQLQLCTRGPPFTMQRLAEILLEPAQFHTRGGESSGGALRGDVLQMALRKCVLVSTLD